MEKQIKNDILSLAQQIFDDVNYNKVLNYLNNNNINDLRLFIGDHLELMSNVFIINYDDQNLLQELKLCNDLEDIIMNEYLETVKT